MTIKINCKPLALNIVQVYAPTALSPEEEIDSFYKVLEETIRVIPRREILVVQGDWNAKIGDTRSYDHLRTVVGSYGIFFKNHIRRLYTWKSPGDLHRNQIDFITIDQRWKSSVTNAKTYPGADCGSDHQLVVAEVRIRFKTPRKSERKTFRLSKMELESFKNHTEMVFQSNIEEETHNIEQLWSSFKTEINKTLNLVSSLRKPPLGNKKDWISAETWSAIKAPKELKINGLKSSADKEKYRDLNCKIQRLSRRDKNSHLNEICRGIECHAEKFQTADLFRRVRQITRQYKSQSWTIEDKNGKLITEFDKVAKRWKEYCADLYSADNSHRTSMEFNWNTADLEPDILQSEVDGAIQKLKCNKALKYRQDL